MAWAALLVVFAGAGVTFLALAGPSNREFGVLAMVWCVVVWAVICAMSAAAAAARGGPVCVVDRRTGHVEAPREGLSARGRITQIWHLSVTLSGERSNVSINQTMIVVESESGERFTIPIATNSTPASAAKRLASLVGAEYRQAGAAEQSLHEWREAAERRAAP